VYSCPCFGRKTAAPVEAPRRCWRTDCFFLEDEIQLLILQIQPAHEDVPVEGSRGIGGEPCLQVGSGVCPCKNRRGKTHTRTRVNEEETEWTNYVNRSLHLGAHVTTDLKDDEETRGRVQKALGVCGHLRKHLLASKDVRCSVKKKVLTGVVLPIMLDGAESWVVSARGRITRGCCRVSLRATRKHRIVTASLQTRLGVATLVHYLDWRMLGHAGHVMRMADGRLPKLGLLARLARSKKRI
jgi:hypothetical protein